MIKRVLYILIIFSFLFHQHCSWTRDESTNPFCRSSTMTARTTTKTMFIDAVAPDVLVEMWVQIIYLNGDSLKQRRTWSANCILLEISWNFSLAPLSWFYQTTLYHANNTMIGHGLYIYYWGARELSRWHHPRSWTLKNRRYVRNAYKSVDWESNLITVHHFWFYSLNRQYLMH